jgi:hypothetical protein
MTFIAQYGFSEVTMGALFAADPYHNVGAIFAIDGVSGNSWRNNRVEDGGDTGSNIIRVSRAAHLGKTCRPPVLKN